MLFLIDHVQRERGPVRPRLDLPPIGLPNKFLSLALTLHDHAEGHEDDGALRVIEKDTLHDMRRRTCGTRCHRVCARARYR